MKHLNEHHSRIEGFDFIIDKIIMKIESILYRYNKEEIFDDKFNHHFYIDINKDRIPENKYGILHDFIEMCNNHSFSFILTNNMNEDAAACINVGYNYIKINAKISYKVLIDKSKDYSTGYLTGTILHELTHNIDFKKNGNKHHFLGGDYYDNLHFENPINHQILKINDYLNPEIEKSIRLILYRFDPHEIQAFISEHLDDLKGDQYVNSFFNSAKEQKDKRGFSYKNKYYGILDNQEEYDDWIGIIIRNCGSGLIWYMDQGIKYVEDDTYEKYKNDFLSICKDNVNEYQTTSLIFSLICYCQTYRKYCHIYIPNKLLVNEDEYNQYKYDLTKELKKRRRNALKKISKIVYDVLEDKINDMNKESFKIYAKNEIMKDYNKKNKKTKDNFIMNSLKRVYKTIYNTIMNL